MTTYYSINLHRLKWIKSGHWNVQSSKTEDCHSLVQILQAGEYKLGSITVRAQLLRDHLRVEVSTDDHDNDLLIQDIFGEFSSIKTICIYAPPQESFYRIDDGALTRDSMKFPPEIQWNLLPKGVERTPPEATWGAQGHLVWEDGQGQQAQSKV